MYGSLRSRSRPGASYGAPLAGAGRWRQALCAAGRVSGCPPSLEGGFCLSLCVTEGLGAPCPLSVSDTRTPTPAARRGFSSSGFLPLWLQLVGPVLEISMYVMITETNGHPWDKSGFRGNRMGHFADSIKASRLKTGCQVRRHSTFEEN